MKKHIPVLCLALLVGCSQQPTSQSEPETKGTGLTQDQVTKLATDFKAEWLKQNPSEPQLAGNSTVRAIKATSTGWHITEALGSALELIVYKDGAV